MSDMKCPYCNKKLKETSIYMDGNNCFSHPYVGALEGGKDRCALDGETLHYRAWQELIKTKQPLEQSEICCAEWEKQALDYKAENIALSIKLEFVVGVLKEIDKLLSSNKFDVNEGPLLNITQTKISMLLNFINIKQITALEQKRIK